MKPTALFHGDLVNSSRIIYTPSDFAKTSLLYLQEVGTLQAAKPHISSRNNLNSYLFFIVQSGSGKLTYNGLIYELAKGSCVFIDCHYPYSHETTNNLWNISWIHFNGPTLNNIYRKYIERGGLSAFQTHNLQLYIDIFSGLYNVASSSAFTRDMELNAGIASLLSTIMSDAWHPPQRAYKNNKSFILDIKEYIDNYYNTKITLDNLSNQFFVDKYYLTRIFKKQFGVSVIDYLIRLRITEAKNMLRFSTLSAKEIGQAVGFSDQYYFSRVFKKIEGISINEYRKQWK